MYLSENTHFQPPSRVQRAMAGVLCHLFYVVTRLIPARWLIFAPTTALRKIKGRVAAWAFSGAYFYEERRAGRI
jgi:hypothetical protein